MPSGSFSDAAPPLSCFDERELGDCLRVAVFLRTPQLGDLRFQPFLACWLFHRSRFRNVAVWVELHCPNSLFRVCSEQLTFVPGRFFAAFASRPRRNSVFGKIRDTYAYEQFQC